MPLRSASWIFEVSPSSIDLLHSLIFLIYIEILSILLYFSSLIAGNKIAVIENLGATEVSVISRMLS